LDHTQLPTPQPTTTGRPPRTPHEQTLATLFTETLNLTTITIDDNFFDLGGHSLLAIRLTNRINTTLNTHTTIHTLFQHPTIADLHDTLFQEADGELFGVLTYRAEGDLPPIFLLPAANGLSWCWSSLVRHLPAGHPVHGLQDPRLSSHDVEALAVKELAAIHLARIREIRGDGPCVLVGWSFGGTVAQQLAVEMEASGVDPSLLVLLDSYHGPDPAGEPTAAELVRTALDGLALPSANAAELPGGHELRRALTEIESPLSTLPDQVIENLVLITRANHRAMTEHIPQPSRVPVLFLDAETGGAAPASHLWRDGLAKDLESHQVGFDHQEIMKSEASPEIGSLISRKVNDVVS
ncbi:alpha/beta fold hydrolase, partial [Streptomyces sp. NPDC088246]|uniref:alpha/beta fold hydrolase n=1 Tax=Streptomyces sp. NPDC088246 TaxID=3365842 RepID=UPI00382951FE